MKTSIVRGVYTDWTAPFFKGFRNQGALDHLNRDDYKNMVLLLSVLKWKQFNGPAILYTDNTGFEYYNSLGILDTWDEVNTEVLENIDTDKFSPSIFWAFAKLLTTKIESRSSVQIDTDLLICNKEHTKTEQILAGPELIDVNARLPFQPYSKMICLFNDQVMNSISVSVGH